MKYRAESLLSTFPLTTYIGGSAGDVSFWEGFLWPERLQAASPTSRKIMPEHKKLRSPENCRFNKRKFTSSIGLFSRNCFSAFYHKSHAFENKRAIKRPNGWFQSYAKVNEEFRDDQLEWLNIEISEIFDTIWCNFADTHSKLNIPAITYQVWNSAAFP
jgi:hypothetical protein